MTARTTKKAAGRSVTPRTWVSARDNVKPVYHVEFEIWQLAGVAIAAAIPVLIYKVRRAVK